MKRKENLHEALATFKRQRIVDEATRLFYERGYQAATVDDIAHALGVTKPFIYGYFSHKTDLLYEVCQAGINRTIETTERILARPEAPEEHLRLLIGELARTVIEEQPHIAVYFREEKYLTDAQSAAIHRKRERFDRHLASLLRRGIATGVFQVPDPDLASLAIGGMVSWTFTWYRPHGRLSDDALVAGMTELALKVARPTA